MRSGRHLHDGTDRQGPHVGPQGDLTADTIQLFLKAKQNELERAEADVRRSSRRVAAEGYEDHLLRLPTRPM